MSFTANTNTQIIYNENPVLFNPAPNKDSKIEWWFFQGYFDDSSNIRYEFMLSFFRNDIADEGEIRDGHFLLFSLYNSKTGSVYKKSNIDPVFFEGMLKTIEKHDRFNLDNDFKELLGKEMRRKGPVKPVEINDTPVIIQNSPFKIKWDDLYIGYDDCIFELRFTVPETNQKCVFTLENKSPLMKMDHPENKNEVLGKMNYHSIPKSLLKGTLDSDTISGQAWIDHQWGDVGWFFSKNRKLLGWDWFGINLEDGTDLIFIKHNDFNNEQVISKYSVVQFNDGTIKQFENFELIKLGLWESPETRINYPVKWRLKIEEIDLDIIFSPIFNEQEIHIPGYARAIWEGAGTVEGTFNTKKIRGRARGEFFGYGYIFDFKNYLNSYSQSVDSRIEEMFPKKFETKNVEYFVGKPVWKYDTDVYTQMFSKPVWELIKRSGKRWRPVFGILMLEALGKPAKNFERLISMIELIHTGALIVDDIQDESPLRRGDKSIHLKYGTDVAINAGNTLYFLPSKEIFGHRFLTQEQKYKVHEIMMNTYLQSHFGQAADIYWSNYLTKKNLQQWLTKNITDEILQMYDFKTGAGAKGIAEVATVVANADNETMKICVNYARSFAVAFQIIDDIHNFSCSEKWTKKSGEDLKNGKLTYVIAHAISLLDNTDKEELVTIFCDKKLRSSENTLNRGINLIQKSGALEKSRNFAKNMAFSSLEELNNHLDNSESKIMLGMLCKRMIDLSFDT